MAMNVLNEFSRSSLIVKLFGSPFGSSLFNRAEIPVKSRVNRRYTFHSPRN